jgi:ABC-type Fe3+ transport system substrate-binding protein
MAQAVDQKLIAPLTIPEAAAFPAGMKSEFWVATDTQFYIAGWNTDLVKKGDEPKSYEELANPKWKDVMMGEARDYQMLIGFGSAGGMFHLLFASLSAAGKKGRPDSAADDGRSR